ncbi:hypothetical protein VKT23_015561 [Stygiomarasmius scandens]|uniref:Gag protein n=1 Tax=Marasmiellus scandens TaxID=2682957 RepID=A0ABR1IXC1_9AGAR
MLELRNLQLSDNNDDDGRRFTHGHPEYTREPAPRPTSRHLSKPASRASQTSSTSSTGVPLEIAVRVINAKSALSKATLAFNKASLDRETPEEILKKLKIEVLMAQDELEQARCTRDRAKLGIISDPKDSDQRQRQSTPGGYAPDEPYAANQPRMRTRDRNAPSGSDHIPNVEEVEESRKSNVWEDVASVATKYMQWNLLKEEPDNGDTTNVQFAARPEPIHGLNWAKEMKRGTHTLTPPPINMVTKPPLIVPRHTTPTISTPRTYVSQNSWVHVYPPMFDSETNAPLNFRNMPQMAYNNASCKTIPITQPRPAYTGSHAPAPILPIPQRTMTVQQGIHDNWFQLLNQALPAPDPARTSAGGGGGNGGRDNDPPKGRKGGGGPPGNGPPDGSPGTEEGSEQSQTPKNTFGKHRGATPFGEIQPEESPHYETEFFEYKPEMPQGQVNLKERVFQMLATLIEWRLFTKYDTVGDAKTQKSLVNSLPKIHPYKGENSIITLDTFVRDLVRHMEIHGLTGPPKMEDENGEMVVSSKDINRTILFAGNLQDAAQEWYKGVAEKPPRSFKSGMNASKHRLTFMQIFRAMYDRFITMAALHEIGVMYDKVKYTKVGGVRQLYSDLVLYAEIMPVPPDAYRFKRKLMSQFPSSMRRKISTDGVTAENSPINDIMQHAISIESGWEANAYYSAQPCFMVEQQSTSPTSSPVAPSDYPLEPEETSSTASSCTTPEQSETEESTIDATAQIQCQHIWTRSSRPK